MCYLSNKQWFSCTLPIPRSFPSVVQIPGHSRPPHPHPNSQDDWGTPVCSTMLEDILPSSSRWLNVVSTWTQFTHPEDTDNMFLWNIKIKRWSYRGNSNPEEHTITSNDPEGLSIHSLWSHFLPLTMTIKNILLHACTTRPQRDILGHLYFA
jgi:hypothetical protein